MFQLNLGGAADFQAHKSMSHQKSLLLIIRGGGDSWVLKPIYTLAKPLLIRDQTPRQEFSRLLITASPTTARPAKLSACANSIYAIVTKANCCDLHIHRSQFPLHIVHMGTQLLTKLGPVSSPGYCLGLKTWPFDTGITS